MTFCRAVKAPDGRRGQKGQRTNKLYIYKGKNRAPKSNAWCATAQHAPQRTRPHNTRRPSRLDARLVSLTVTLRNRLCKHTPRTLRGRKKTTVFAAKVQNTSRTLQHFASQTNTEQSAFDVARHRTCSCWCGRQSHLFFVQIVSPFSSTHTFHKHTDNIKMSSDKILADYVRTRSFIDPIT